MPYPIRRRSLLKGLGLGAAAAALPILRNARVFSQSATIPKRVIFFYAQTGNLSAHPHETQRATGHWEPLAPAGMSEPTETEFELNTLLTPLAPYKQDLILFENLDLAQKWADPTAPRNAHIEGGSIALTGADRFNDALPGAVSIDQLIAQQLNSPSPLTRLPSLEIFGSHLNSAESIASASGPGQLMPVLFEPPQLYDRVFPEPQDPDAQAMAAALADQRARVFDLVLGQHGALRDQLAGDDREKLQQHFDTVADLQRRLSLGLRDVPLPLRSITDPWADTYMGYTTQDSPISTQVWNMNVDLNMEIAVAALHADVTRVVMMHVNDPPDNAFGFVAGQYGANDGHDLQHKGNDATTTQYADPDARATLRQHHQLVMNKFAALIDMLATRTESDGQRLLDHTVVVYCSQIANGSHDLTRLPWIVVGGADGYFSTGRYLRFPRMAQPYAPMHANVGRPHNDLFVSVANAMGLDIDTFGNPDVCTGPIEEMRG